LTSALIHYFYIDAFIAHVAAQKPTDCVCSIPEVEALPPLSTSDLKSAWEAALAEREQLCIAELEKCNAKTGAADEKAEEAEASSALLDDEEEDDDFEL